MNAYFVGGAFLYQLLLALSLVMADADVAGNNDQTVFRAGVYLLAVLCSLILAISAVKSAVTKRRTGLMRWATWPPEWDVAVAAWSVGKAIFLTTLFFAVMFDFVPEWAITASVVIFADTHVLFTGKWIALPEERP